MSEERFRGEERRLGIERRAEGVMRAADPELLRRLDNIKIKDGVKLEVAPNILLRGLVSVPITFDRRED